MMCSDLNSETGSILTYQRHCTATKGFLLASAAIVVQCEIVPPPMQSQQTTATYPPPHSPLVFTD